MYFKTSTRCIFIDAGTHCIRINTSTHSKAGYDDNG